MSQQQKIGDVEEDTTLVSETPANKESQFQAPIITKRRLLAAFFTIGIGLFVLSIFTSKESSSGLSPKTGASIVEVQEETANHKADDAEADIFADVDEMMEHHEEYAINCTAEEFAKLEPGSHEYLVKEADCGSGYEFDDSKRNEQKPVHVILFGDHIKENFQLTGCMIGSRCGHHPKCQFSLATSERDPVLSVADVIVTSTVDADSMSRISPRSKKPKVRRILYWREAWWPNVPIQQQRFHFDLGMGVHFTSGVMNPNYLRRPRTLIARSFVEFLPFKERNQFALSIISNCGAHSERLPYIQHLTDYLGPERVHQYGACGNRKLPPPPIKNAAKVIAKYKFYLSFENTIQNGYVSEKLFTVLNMPLLPVYMGAYNVPNITKIPSYINAYHYHSPKALAEHLLYLDANPEAYGRYHLWRKDTSLFTEEYLNLIKYKFPGQPENKPYCKTKGCGRIAACCRLCNLQHLDEQIAKRTDADLIPKVADSHQINRDFFSGKLTKRPGPHAKLPDTAGTNSTQ